MTAVLIHVGVIAGLALWATYLGRAATKSLPAAQVQYAAISLWVNDQHWRVHPELSIRQNSWTIGLSEQPAARAPAAGSASAEYRQINPNAEAVLVLWGAARLADPHVGVGTRSTPVAEATHGSYFNIDVPSPSAQLHPYTSGGWSLPKNPPVPVQVFAVTARDLESYGRDSELVLPASAGAPPNLYSQTASGWTVYVPDFANGGSCPGPGEALPQDIAKRLQTQPQDWHGVICPAPKATARLNLGPDEHLNSSSIPPTATEENTGNPVWEIEPGFLGVAYQSGNFGGFWVDVADGEIAAAAQRDLLFAGVLYGLAGGLAAAWLVPGVSGLVQRASRSSIGSQQ